MKVNSAAAPPSSKLSAAWELSRDLSQIENGRIPKCSWRSKSWRMSWRMWRRMDGWMVGVGRPVTCRINGCGGACRWLMVRAAERQRRSPGLGGGPHRATPALGEDHTAPPRAQRSPEQQSHGATRTCQQPSKVQKTNKKIKTLSSKQISCCHKMF